VKAAALLALAVLVAPIGAAAQVCFSKGPFVPVDPDPVGPFVPSSRLVDVDDDASLELLSYDIQRSGTLHLQARTNRGGGLFSAPLESVAGVEVMGVGYDVGDLDGDRLPDTVHAYADTFGGTTRTMRNRGDGTFEWAASLGPFETSTLRIVDFDGGLADVVAAVPAMAADPLLRLYPNLGGFSFGTPVDTPVAPLVNVDAIDVGDVDRDGYADVLVAGTGAAIYTYLGDGGGRFPVEVVTPLAITPRGLALGDLYGDPAPDLAVVDDLTLVLLEGLGNGSFVERARLALAATPAAVATADVDGKGFDEVVVTENPGLEVFGPTGLLFSGLTDRRLDAGATFGDLNGNGLLDMVVNEAPATTTDWRRRVFLNCGARLDVLRDASLRTLDRSLFDLSTLLPLDASDLYLPSAPSSGLDPEPVIALPGWPLIFYAVDRPGATLFLDRNGNTVRLTF